MEPGVTTEYGALISRSTTTTDNAILGRRRIWSNFSALEWVYLVLSIINILGMLGLTIYSFVGVMTTGQQLSADYTLSILIFANVVFCVCYIFISLFSEMEPLVYVYLVAIGAIVIYCTIEYGVKREKRTEIKKARLIVAWILGALNLPLGGIVAYRFKWLQFRINGPRERLQRMYREALWFICILIFNFQVVYSILILILTHDAEMFNKKLEIVFVFVGFVISPLLAILGWFTIHLESKTLAWTLGFSSLLEPAYVIYKIVTIAKALASSPDPTAAKDSITLAACALSLVVRGIIFFGLYRVSRNFGQGLKEKISGHGWSTDQSAPCDLQNIQ